MNFLLSTHCYDFMASQDVPLDNRKFNKIFKGRNSMYLHWCPSSELNEYLNGRPSICSCSFHIRNILNPETLYPYCRLWLSSLLVAKQHKVTKFLHHTLPLLSCTHQTHLWKKEKVGMSLTNSTRLHVSLIIINPQFLLGNFQDIFFWKNVMISCLTLSLLAARCW